MFVFINLSADKCFKLTFKPWIKFSDLQAKATAFVYTILQLEKDGTKDRKIVGFYEIVQIHNLPWIMSYTA